MSQVTFTTQAIGPLAGAQCIVFVCDDLKLPDPVAGSALEAAAARIAGIESFKGKAQTAIAVKGVDGGPDSLIVIGLGKADELGKTDFTTLGGFAAGKLGKGDVTVLCGTAAGPFSAADIARFAQGMRLRLYRFDKYKTVKTDEEPPPQARMVALQTADPAALRKALKPALSTAEGVEMARDLVNEPPNILNPETFAKRAKALKDLGVEVEILGEKELRRIGMRALLGVGQGSHAESQVVIMRWSGARNPKDQPIAFIGKGVTFDTGGISLKPAANMEDMRTDMGGAAAVAGAMRALAGRKAKANVVGVCGLVENMPSDRATRPGDVVTSLSGLTVEIINTDAEGRLVLIDAMTWTQRTYQPDVMIDLATLTGAMVVAVAHEYGGMFANDDTLAGQLTAAGLAVDDKLWRFPLSEVGGHYDKMIDSPLADMKNVGPREGGSITAAQFLQRVVENGVKWAHLDIAGAVSRPKEGSLHGKGATGFGVRLLDRFVRDTREG